MDLSENVTNLKGWVCDMAIKRAKGGLGIPPPPWLHYSLAI